MVFPSLRVSPMDADRFLSSASEASASSLDRNMAHPSSMYLPLRMETDASHVSIGVAHHTATTCDVWFPSPRPEDSQTNALVRSDILRALSSCSSVEAEETSLRSISSMALDDGIDPK